jgi:hypothetical protein
MVAQLVLIYTYETLCNALKKEMAAAVAAAATGCYAGLDAMLLA